MKIIRLMISHAVRSRASDIHVELDGQISRIRFRVDGILHDASQLRGHLHPAVVSCVKNMADLNIAEHRMPQEGHFRIWVDEADINIRVATSPTRTYEKLAMRILDKKLVLVNPSRLGFRPESLIIFERAIHEPHGLILTTGPTGSGKTTLLYSALNELNDGQKNIVTIEDPIEYELAGVNQIEVNIRAGVTYGNTLKSIMRQDPDVIMVGEIRDSETVEVAISAALTGHLVFSTLHTLDASSAFGRLLDLGADPKRIAAGLCMIVAQRLIRKICPKCKKNYKITQEELDLISDPTIANSETSLFVGKGCSNCDNTGFVGRTGIFEILVPNTEIRQLMEKSQSLLEIRNASRRAGMKTLREEGVLKAVKGITTLAEVLRVTDTEVRNFTEA